jgi:hypothetical protein
MTAYLTIDELKLRAVGFPWFDELERDYPGWLDAQLEQESRNIDSRLRKRYAVPFALPAPAKACEWLARLVTHNSHYQRGFRASDDESVELAKTSKTDALAEMKEAADSVVGLYDLPLASGASGISKGGPQVYSEQSPYVGFDQQGQTGRSEDSSRRGTTRG